MQKQVATRISPSDNRVLVEPERAVQNTVNSNINELANQNIANVEEANVPQATNTTHSSFLTKTFSWTPASLQG